MTSEVGHQVKSWLVLDVSCRVLCLAYSSLVSSSSLDGNPTVEEYARNHNRGGWHSVLRSGMRTSDDWRFD